MSSVIRIGGGPSYLRQLSKRVDDPQLDIILVPGADRPRAESWPFCSHRWLSDVLPKEAWQARIWTFDYTFPMADSFSLQNIWLEGERLLKLLADSRKAEGCHESQTQFNRRPMLLISHSLGGIILKQAFCVANEQLHRYEYLVNQVAGIIFISTPHLGSKQTSILEAVLLMLKASTRTPLKLSPQKSEEESSILLDLSVRFETIHLRAPILSIHETKETRVQDGRFRHKSAIVVDRAACTTQAPNERFLAVHADHVEICNLRPWDNTAEKTELSQFVDMVLKKAEETISSRLEALDFRYSADTSYSPTNSVRTSHSFERIKQENDTARKGSAVLKGDTGHATDGSSSTTYEILPAISGFNSRLREPCLPCRILDCEIRNDEFVGREDVLELMSKTLLPSQTKIISSESEGLKQFALCGMGGIGKTETATEFALRHKEKFDAVFWIGADGVAKMDACFSNIAVRLGLEDQVDSTNQIVSRELVKGWLSNPWKMVTIEGRSTRTTASWLIIFDNADDQYSLTDYWPLQGSGSVLITSRDPMAKSYFSANSSGVDLEPLGDQDGAVLLKMLTHDFEEEEGQSKHISENISRSLGGLPLAISQMAGVIRRQELRLSEFAESYSDPSEHAELHKLKFHLGRGTYPHTISSVWAFESLKPTSNCLLGALAFMDSSHIQEFLLTDIPAKVVMKQYPTKPSSYRAARTELIQASLIKRYKDKNELTLHRLVQDSFRAKMSIEEKVDTFQFAISAIYVHWPRTMMPPTKPGAPVVAYRLWMIDRWPICESLNPHVLRLKQLYESGICDSWHGSRLEFASLLRDAAWVQFERGRTHGFDNSFDLAMKFCEHSDEPEASSILVDIHICLGTIASETNAHDTSRNHKQRALEIQLQTRQKFDTVDLRLARCYSEMGIAHTADGKYDAAAEMFLESISIEEQLGVYPSWVAQVNLGIAYIQQGSLDKADALLTATQERREKMFGKMDAESFRPGRIFHALARLREGQGREAEAFEFDQMALKSYLSTIGDHHHRTADICHRVAAHMIRAKRYDEALMHIDQALSIWQYASDTFRPEIARTTFLKATLLRLLGKDMRANVFLKKACSLRRECMPSISKPDAAFTVADFTEPVTFQSR